MEERTAAAWRAVVPELEGPQRQVAVSALTACAVRATRWRRIQGTTPTVPFPGV